MDYNSDVLKFAEYLATQIFTPIFWGGRTSGIILQVVLRS